MRGCRQGAQDLGDCQIAVIEKLGASRRALDKGLGREVWGAPAACEGDVPALKERALRTGSEGEG